MKPENYHKKSLDALYKLAQSYFNRYIRLRDASKGCITCGKPVQEAGHFQHGGNNKYSFWCDFNEKNLNGSCTQCNHFLSGNLGIYSEKLEEMYPHGIIQELNSLRHKSDQWGKEDLIDIICKYKEKIKNLI